MSDALYHIGLSSWIVQDGNYPDFERGKSVRFALEFYAERGLSIASKSSDLSGLIHRHDAVYEARGIVRFCEADVWVVDFGGVMAYETRARTKVAVGTVVTGELYLGIDPFFYFEELSKIPGMPPLIYEWQIESIEMETAPLIEDPESGMLVRDQSKLRRVSVAGTDAWKDDGGNADYTLICRRTSSAPSRDLHGRVKL